MFFTPEFQGQMAFQHLPDDFVERLEQRVEGGLFVPGRRSRAEYRVLSSGSDEIEFAAEGFLTQYNVGLNHVVVRRCGANQLEYHVSFWGWTRYAVAHGTALGLLFVTIFALMPDMRRQIVDYPRGAALFWSLVAFFSLAWPWLLTALHRGAARQALERILREALAGPPGADAPAEKLA